MIKPSRCLIASGIVGVAIYMMPVHAADRSHLAAWTVTSSAAAPWSLPGEAPVQSDLDALIGKTVTFTAKRIVAPPPLACSGPHYELKTYAPDMLFQGGLTDPGKQAAALGFQGASIQTLETGCEGAIDFHFVSPLKAEFGLNNRVYVMKRRGP